ncbi:MAG: hypothetical protein KBT27_15215 [Prevotellaceae bacterium]|nr:hypothetical protein [Candidatus Faecinaster equi]
MNLQKAKDMENKFENSGLQVIVSAIELTNHLVDDFNNAQSKFEKELRTGIDIINTSSLKTEERAQFKKEYIDKVDSIIVSCNAQVRNSYETIKEIRSYYRELLNKFIAYKDNKKVELSNMERLYFLSIGDCSNEDMELCKRLVNEYKLK